jgi:Fur family transcriptional regulator, ferric uptake regulator
MVKNAFMKPKEQLFIELRTKGFRLTPQRERVVDIFYNLPEGEHLSAEALYSILKRETADISLATSYRSLKLLASMGVLREVDFSEDHKQYELVRDEETPHHHLICITCGLAKEFESDIILKEALGIANTLQFEVVDLQMKLYATCLPEKADCPKRLEAVVS